MRLFYLFFLIVFASCAKNEIKTKPKFIKFQEFGDSIFVVLKNPVLGNTFLKIKNLELQQEKYIDFKKPDSIKILQFSKNEFDSIKVLEKYEFAFLYGPSNLKRYDTLYNYTLPFLKGKRYKTLQGQNTNFTHKGNFSKYAIDFKMKVGETVCAIRDGLVVNVKEDSNIGGGLRKYLKYANYIVVAHNDGTYAQYVHLKKEGAIAKIGDTVKQGEPIGYSGNTGFSTQPHLHFAVYKPTPNGFASIPFVLNGFSSSKYKKGKFAKH